MNRFACITLCALLPAGAALSQNAPPPGTPAYNSVQDVLNNPVDDARVTLEGLLLRRLGGDKFVFSDGAHEIQVEIDRQDFPQVRVSDAARVRIEGEIDVEPGKDPQIEVDRLMMLGAET